MMDLGKIPSFDLVVIALVTRYTSSPYVLASVKSPNCVDGKEFPENPETESWFSQVVPWF